MMKMLMIKNHLVVNLVIFSFVALLGSAQLITETGATFTDLQDNTDNALGTGTLDISTTPVSQVFSLTDLVPGDSATRTVSVVNNGNVDFTYGIDATGTGTALWTDPTYGLELLITYGTTTYYNGLISELSTNTAPDLSLTTGASQDLSFKVTLPLGADSSFEGLLETVTFTFEATQRDGRAR